MMSCLSRSIFVAQMPTDRTGGDLLQHVSPLGWEHINLTGDYVWRKDRKVEEGKFRPLRPFPKA